MAGMQWYLLDDFINSTANLGVAVYSIDSLIWPRKNQWLGWKQCYKVRSYVNYRMDFV